MTIRDLWQTYRQNHKADINQQTLNLLQKVKAAHELPCFLTKLDAIGVIKINGEQTEKFLQGQLTSNVEHLADGHSQLSGICSIKGRMISNFRIHHLGNDYFLAMDNSLLEKTLTTLKKYAVFFKTTLSIDNDWQLFGLGGTDIDTLNLVDSLPNDINQIKRVANGFIVKIADKPCRYELWLNKDSEILDHLLSATTVVDETVWQCLNIQSGLAFLSEKTSEEFLPQMLNFDKIGGVSYQKGCYTGQEIVARAHYRGQVKKHLHHISVDYDQLIDAGEKIISTNTQHEIVMIIQSIKTETNRYDCLAVLDDQSIQGNEFTIIINESKINCKIIHSFTNSNEK